MKKYFLKKNGKEVKLGDKIKTTKYVNTSYGKGEVTIEVTINHKETLDILVEEGILEVKKSKDCNSMSLSEKLEQVMKKLNCAQELLGSVMRKVYGEEQENKECNSN